MNLAGAGVDPAALIFRLQDPEGNDETYTYGTDTELVKDAVGEYHIDVPLETLKKRAIFIGRWEARDASGIAYGAAENIIETISDYREQNA